MTKWTWRDDSRAKPMTTLHPAHLGQVDREALQRALEIARRDPRRAAQLEWKEKTYGWYDAAHLAAYICQCEGLMLRPWQDPPLYGDSTDGVDDFEGAGRAHAADLLRRLLAAGLSRFEPEPMQALARAEAVKSLKRAATESTPGG
jgi:hypothetical protein